MWYICLPKIITFLTYFGYSLYSRRLSKLMKLMTFFLLFQILFDNVTDEGVKLRKLFRLAIAYRFVKCLNICFWILYLKNIQKQVQSVFLFQHSRYYFCTRLFLFQQINVHLHPTKRLSYYSYSCIV